MSESRLWKFPRLSDGATINFMADTQSGFRPQFTDNWNTRIAEDLQTLKLSCSGHVHGGDCVEGYADYWEDQKYRDFRKSVLRTRLPYLDVPGNHDLCTYNNPRFRSADEWAREVVGRQQSNMVSRMGDVAVIGLAPEYWKYDFKKLNYAPPEPLSSQTLQWLSSELDKLGNTPTWLVTHALPPGQSPTASLSDPEFTQPWGAIGDVLASHGNAIGWLSGHWHIRPETTAIGLRVLNAGGRKIYGINAPSASGINAQSAYDHRWLGNARSMFVTYQGDAVDIRWRNHTSPGWMNVNGKDVHQLTLK